MDTLHENQIAKLVLDKCFKIHRLYGPSLLESAYQKILAFELEREGMDVKTEVSVPVNHEGLVIPTGFRADMIVNDKVILELKACDGFHDVHFKQLTTYLRLTGLKLGLLLNFKQSLMKEGIKRIVIGEIPPNLPWRS